jgi:hypothetical protein
MYFSTKSYLKSNHNYTVKYTLHGMDVKPTLEIVSHVPFTLLLKEITRNNCLVHY